MAAALRDALHPNLVTVSSGTVHPEPPYLSCVQPQTVAVTVLVKHQPVGFVQWSKSSGSLQIARYPLPFRILWIFFSKFFLQTFGP